jgi:hypothetical protein
MSDANSVSYLPARHPAILTADPTKHGLKPNSIGLPQSTVSR